MMQSQELPRGRIAAIVMVFAALAVGCAAQQTVKAPSSKAQGYLAAGEYPDSLALLPEPPAKGSAMLAQDEAVSKEAHAMRDTPRWNQAALDADLRFPQAAETFSCALDAPITEKDSPHLYTMLRRMMFDAGRTTSPAKDHYGRPRPFLVYGESSCTPGDEAILRINSSYPSGHATIGWASALVLAEIAPDRTNALLARGRSFGESRIVCNVHWQSDVLQGMFLGAGLAARLHANAEFLSDLAAAKTEFAALRAKGLKPTRDCAAEATALSQKLKLAM